MGANEQGADYFQPLKSQRVAEQQQQSQAEQLEPVADPKCNCGAMPGRPVAECEQCRPQPEPSGGYGDASDRHPADGLTRECLAEWHTHFWKRADEIKEMVDGCPLTKDLPLKTGYSSNRLIKALIDRLQVAEQRVTAAEKRRVEQYDRLVRLMRKHGLETDKTGDLESYGFDVLLAMFAGELVESRQRASETEARCANACAELEKIATGTHPLYVMRADAQMIQPGDVVLRPTGEVRKVRDGEWFMNGDDRCIRHDGYLTVSKFPIYRRIDAPAGDKPTYSVPPVAVTTGTVLDAPSGETAKCDEIVEHDGKRYRREAVRRLPKAGETFWGSISGNVQTAPFHFMLDSYHILHEIVEPSPAPTAESGKVDWRWTYLNGEYSICVAGGLQDIRIAQSSAVWLNRRDEIESQLAQLYSQADQKGDG